MLSGREKNLLIVSVTLGAIAVLYAGVIDPIAASWKTLNNELESKLCVLAKDTRLIMMYDRLEAAYAKYRDFIAKEDEEEVLRAVLGELETISKKSQCHIVNVTPRASRVLAGYKEISFTVIAEGAIDKLSQFLYSVEVSPSLLRVKEFTITPKSGSSGNLKASLAISKILVNEVRLP